MFRSADPDSVQTPNWGQGDASTCGSRAAPLSLSADSEIPHKKALRGERGENKSFPPSNTTSLYKLYFKTVRWTVLKEQYRADLNLQHSKIAVQKQSTGLFLRKDFFSGDIALWENSLFLRQTSFVSPTQIPSISIVAKVSQN